MQVVAAPRGIQAGEVFLDTLHAYGIDHIFSSPGSEWPAVWEALAKNDGEGRPGPRYWNCRHEALAASMALGYNKASGRTSATLFHASVGPVNATMALRTAYQERVPMLVASGETTTWGETADDELDPARDVGGQWLRHLGDVGGPARLIAPYVMWSNSVASVEALPGMLQHACRIAMSPPLGPTYLCISMEVLLGCVPSRLIPRPPPPAGSSLADPALLDQAAEFLLASRSPVIVTEELGRDPMNVGRLVTLAESLAIPVVEAQTPAYLNFPRDHPLHLGFDAQRLVTEADTVLLLGTRGPWHPPSLAHSAGTKIILADEDPTKALVPMWGYSADLVIGGSLRSTLDGLIARTSDPSSRPRATQEAVQERFARHKAQHERQREAWERDARTASSARPIDVRWAVQALSDVLPAEALVVEEVTSPRTFLLRHLSRSVPGTYIGRMTGGLGVGLGSAIGAKVGQPGSLVVALIGDGAFNYNPSLAGLGFLQEYGIPLLIVVFNNGSYASMKNGLQRHYPEGWARRTGVFYGAGMHPAPDYSALAPMFGGHGERVEDPSQLKPVLKRALEAVENGRFAIVDLVQAPANPRGA